MSDLKSPLYVNQSKVETFAATPIAQVIKTAAGRKVQPLDPQEELERQKREVLAAAEKLGRERGHAKGFIEGYEEGKKVGAQEARSAAEDKLAYELDQFMEGLGKISTELQSKIEEWFETSELQMTDLAMKALRKLLCAELSISRESALEIIKDALRDVTHSRHARIRINPFDSPTLREHKNEIMSASGNLRDIEFVSDSSIPGGCVIETEGGVVDATTETKLILIENQLRLAS